MTIFRISVNRLQTAADCGPQRKDCSCGTFQNAFLNLIRIYLFTPPLFWGVIFLDKIDNVKEDFAQCQLFILGKKGLFIINILIRLKFL